jgi:hypothetical protein
MCLLEAFRLRYASINLARLESHGNKDELGNTTDSGDTGEHGG